MRLFQCDKCEEQTTDPLFVCVSFERTPEEIDQLMAAKDAPNTDEVREKFKVASMVTKEYDLCRDCYNSFIEDWKI